jgi:UDP-N-acetyl-D-mannosaminuronic acid transferase (WecB/TagA/CpsF family)
MQRAGLEWLFRFCHDPHRLARRYLLNSPTVFRLLLAARFGRLL